MNGSSSVRRRSTLAKNSGEPSGASPWAAPQGSASQKSWTRAFWSGAGEAVLIGPQGRRCRPGRPSRGFYSGAPMEEAAITQRRTSGTAIATPPTRAGSALTRLDALLRPLEIPRRLVFYGLIAGLLCATIMIVVAPHPFPLMGSRLAGLHSATIARMHGDPLLTAAAPHGNGLTAANASDDQGLFLFGPMVGDLLGTSDPTEILIALRAILFGIAAAVLPLALWRLTSSLTVAVAAPFAVTLVVLGMRIYDLYWIGAWAILGLVPMVLAVAGRPRRSTFWVLVIACALAGLATSIRNY